MIVFWGGSTDEGLIAQVNSFDCISSIWKTEKLSTSSFQPTAAYSLASHLNTIYLFGGIQGNTLSEYASYGAGVLTNQLLEYDARYRRLNLIQPENKDIYPEPRAGATITYVPANHSTNAEPSLYLFGGFFANGDISNELLVFNIPQRSWNRPIIKGNRPSAKESHTTTYYHSQTTGQRLLIFFGGQGSKGKSNEIFYLDLDREEWIFPKVSGLSVPPRSQHTAVIYQHFMIIHGGLNPDTTCDTLCFNIDTLQWDTLSLVSSSTLLPSPSANLSASIIGNKVFYFGGKYQNSETCHNETYILELGPPTPSKLTYTSQLDRCTLTWITEELHQPDIQFELLARRVGKPSFTQLVVPTKDLKKYEIEPDTIFETPDRKSFSFDGGCTYEVRLLSHNFAGSNSNPETGYRFFIINDDGLEAVKEEAEEEVVEYGQVYQSDDSDAPEEANRFIKQKKAPDAMEDDAYLFDPEFEPFKKSKQSKTNKQKMKKVQAPQKRKISTTPRVSASNSPNDEVSPLSQSPFSLDRFPFNISFGDKIDIHHSGTENTKIAITWYAARAVQYIIGKEVNSDGFLPVFLKVHWSGWDKTSTFELNLTQTSNQSEEEWMASLATIIRVSTDDDSSVDAGPYLEDEEEWFSPSSFQCYLNSALKQQLRKTGMVITRKPTSNKRSKL